MGFRELNCRTYVRFRGQGGICFFSLDAGNLIAVLGARTFPRVPYFHSDMDLKSMADGTSLRSKRMRSTAAFTAKYRPSSPAHFAMRGSLEHWPSERYCFFTVVGGEVYRTDIHHQPWLLQDAVADLQYNSVITCAGLPANYPPIMMSYAESQEVLIWPLRNA
jgi:hypothetical protein